MNELNFLDLVILKKVDAESSVERFGSIINTSFFETANLLGTVKIKGYINIDSSLGGISKVALTEAGSALLLVAEQRAKEPIEPLDNAILHALAGGAKDLESLQSKLNIRSGDLAFHINKLVVQSFMDYSVRSAKVEFVLTEQGFNCVGGVRVQQKLGGEETVKPSSALFGTNEGGMQDSSEGKKENIPATPIIASKNEAKPDKEDVAHLLEADKPNSHQPDHKKHASHKHEDRELTEDEKKRKRLYSKIEYYLTEYMPYLILIIVVAIIFIAAVFLSISKLT